LEKGLVWGKLMKKELRQFGQKFRDMALVHKIIFLYILIIFIPMIILGTFYIGNFSVHMKEQYVAGKTAIMDQCRKSIENNLSQVVFCTRSFQSNADLLHYVESEDFSTANGAYTYMKTVLPVFLQMKATYTDYQTICIYRRFEKRWNDPAYVLNGLNVEVLKDTNNMSMKSMKTVVYTDEKSGVTMCRMYMALYDSRYSQKIGFSCIACSFETIFQSLGFMENNETMLFSLNNSTWSIVKNEQGKLCLTPYDGEIPGEENQVSITVEPMGAKIDYYYQNFKLLSNNNLISVLIGMILILAFFTVMCYLFYYSITKRITDLTGYMLRMQKDRMAPFKIDASQDEIGTMIRVYNDTAERMNKLIDEIYQKERLMGQAQYYAMQSQIQPHFLYNTLENIDMLIEMGEYEKASQMIALFGRILRYNVSKNQEKATVGEEVSHITDYLKLYSYRMRDDFHYEVNADPSCYKILCPYCMLQPVIENCFRHGFRHEEREFWVSVNIFWRDEFVYLEIEDNGSGIEPDKLRQIEQCLKKGIQGEKEKNSIGLLNVHERIQLLCGEECGLRLERRKQGCLVTIRLKEGLEE
jgi:two-component system sensor histidine kinase YesM